MHLSHNAGYGPWLPNQTSAPWTVVFRILGYIDCGVALRSRSSLVAFRVAPRPLWERTTHQHGVSVCVRVWARARVCVLPVWLLVRRPIGRIQERAEKEIDGERKRGIERKRRRERES